jgi:chromate transporter
MLVQLGILVTLLSLLAFGGANAIVPELHRQLVDVMRAMSDADFTNLFALAQTAPGPNVLILPLVGWRLAGAAGLAVASLATVLPTSALALVTGRILSRAGDSRFLKALRAGLVPLAIGLILASGFVLARAADRGAPSIAITVLGALALVFTRVNPIWVMAAAAATGVAGRLISP